MNLFLNIFTIYQNQESIHSSTIKPIMEPPPVEFTFETIGWAILFWTGILTILIIIIRRVISYKKNKYRRDALNVLSNLNDSLTTNQQIATQLKLVAIKTYGRKTVAHLSGKDWISFLQSKGKLPEFSNLDTFLMECLYKNKLDLEQSNQFLTYSKKWIKTHD